MQGFDEYLTTVVERITDAFFALDEEWRFVYLNSEAERVLFRERENLLGKNVWEEFPEAVDLRFYREYHRAMAEQVTVEFEEYYPPLETWFEVKVYPSVSGLSVYFRDVTERKRTQEALRESEARYARIATNAPGMVYQFVLHPDGSVGFTYVSEGSRELYGIEPREIQQDAAVVIDMIHPEDRPGFDRSVEASAATLSPWKWEGRFVLRSGEQKWLQGTSRPQRQDNGDILWDGLLIDITERKRAEVALRESERRLRAVLVQYGSDVIMILDANGTIRYQSPAVERVLGYRPEELVGERGLDYLHPEDVERASDELYRIMNEPGVHDPIEYRFRRKDGSWLHLEGIGNNLLDDPDVRGIVIASRDVTERKNLEEQLKHQAFHDSLTDLPNRALFVDRLGHAVARNERREGQVAVLFVDLDNFKFVNDTLGHHAGDELLIAVSDRLRKCLRPADTAARLGGDEFAVLLEDVEGVGEAERVAERMIKELRTPFALGGQEVYVTPSIGIALGGPGRNPPEDLLRKADVAMYWAKDEGKARHKVFDPDMEAQVVERLGLENDLRRALEHDELELCFQPIVGVDTGQILGMEALVRWEHPERGLVMPSEFVALAEEIGLIVPIGQLVLREACRQAKEWQERYSSDPPLIIGLNVSARQLRHPDLLRDVKGALDENGLKPGNLTLEITESTLVEDEEHGIKSLRRLQDLGVRFALDDFGTGYSSLSYLKRLPISLLKLNASFTERLVQDSEDEVLLSGIVAIASRLGMSVLAEGVETPEQLTRLRSLGCDLAQGYYFSGPLSPQAAGDLLDRAKRAPST